MNKKRMENKKKWAEYEGVQYVNPSPGGVIKSKMPGLSFLQCRECKRKTYQKDVPGDIEDLDACPKCGYAVGKKENKG